MWETIFNVGMVVVGMSVLAFIAWAVDKDKKNDSEDYFTLDDDDF